MPYSKDPDHEWGVQQLADQLMNVNSGSNRFDFGRDLAAPYVVTTGGTTNLYLGLPPDQMPAQSQKDSKEIKGHIAQLRQEVEEICALGRAL